MDMMLLVVTVVSLVVAAASATVAWQVTRTDRQRRAARVAALATAAGVGQPVGAAAGAIPAATIEPAPWSPPIASSQPASRSSRAVSSQPAPWPSPAASTQPAPWAATAMHLPSALDEFMPARDEGPEPGGRRDAATGATTGSGGLFAGTAATSEGTGRQHWLMGAAGAMATAVVVFAVIGFMGSRAGSESAAAPVRVPLELVALSHNRVDGKLAVAGLVRNPPAGTQVQTLEAEVRVFDGAGILIATQAARVETPQLGPGQESPFAVALGEVATAARYRVSFRTAGTMLPHVDRRVNAPAAVTAEAR